MIPVNEPILSGNEKKYLSECIDTGWISSEGPFVSKFENQLAERLDRGFGVAVANGSVALDVAFAALDLKKGDEVILPTFTIISCLLPILRTGATPVFIDSCPKTWNMDVERIEEKVTDKTKIILVVHIYGLPVDMDKVLQIGEKFKIKVIEDAAEMIGQAYKGKPCGSFGDISVLSFYPNKHITTGEGGMVLTNNEEIANKCKELRNLCFIPPRRFIHKDLGWNFRMTNMQAALGVAQLERLDEFVEKKREIGRWYNSLLSDLTDYIDLPLSNTDYAENIYWVYGVVLKEHIKLDALQVMKLLQNEGIGTRPFFYPLHKQPVLLDKFDFKTSQNFHVSENISEMGFYLPSGLALTFQQAKEVAIKLKMVLK